MSIKNWCEKEWKIKSPMMKIHFILGSIAGWLTLLGIVSAILTG